MRTLSGYMIKWFRCIQGEAMVDFEERVELACAIDRAKQDRAMGTKSEVIMVTEKQLQEMTSSVAHFVRSHNDYVLSQESKCRTSKDVISC